MSEDYEKNARDSGTLFMIGLTIFTVGLAIRYGVGVAFLFFGIVLVILAVAASLNNMIAREEAEKKAKETEEE